MTGGTASNYFVHSVLRAHDWQHRPQLDQLRDWWRDGGRGVLALVGMGGAGKTAIVERFLRILPGGLPADPDVPKDATLTAPHGVFVFSFYDAPNPEAFFESLQIWLENTPRIQTILPLGQLLFLMQQTQGLIVLDGLEKVQEDGVRGYLGRLGSPKLREFLDRIAAGYFPQLSVLVTSRFPMADLRDARPQFFRALSIEEIELAAGIRLLRARGVRGTEPQLASIVNACGRHALTVDFAGGYIAEFGEGDSRTPVEFEIDSAWLEKLLDDEPDESRRNVIKQGYRFARVAERYRDAMLGLENSKNGKTKRSEGDAAALALLERICLFRLGVNSDTLADIFTGQKAKKISGSPLAGLNPEQLKRKLNWLVRMRIAECTTSFPMTESAIRQAVYTVHPAVRDGFLGGFAVEVKRKNHDAVRRGLMVSLGDAPGQKEAPADATELDLLEEIVHHAIQSGHVREAWDIYLNRIGGARNLHWRLAAYERGERICRAFAGVASPENLSTGLPPTYLKRLAEGEERSQPFQSLPEYEQASLMNEWALYLGSLGRLLAAARCYEFHNRIKVEVGRLEDAAIGYRNLTNVLLLAGRLLHSQVAAAESMRLVNESAEFAKLEVPSFRTFCGLSDAEIPRQRRFSHAYRAHAHALRGDVPTALDGFCDALKWQRKAEVDHERPLYSLCGIWHSQLLVRLGRHHEVNRLVERNLEIWAKEHQRDGARCNLILSEMCCETAELAQAESLRTAAHDWAVARDDKEVLCWSALVQTKIECSSFSFRCSDAKNAGLALDRARIAVAEGLKIARECGFGIFHIDLLIERAKLHLLTGEPLAALNDIHTALDIGVPANENTGQVELLAATHTDCGYAWGTAQGMSLRGEALLLQAAQMLGQATFVPARRSTLVKAIGGLLFQAEPCFIQALDLWHPLHDPAPERPNQNFQLDGKEYNNRASRTHRILTDLAGGVLTNHPLVALRPDKPRVFNLKSNPKKESMSKRFAVALSFPGEHRPYVQQIAESLAAAITTRRVFYDQFYEAELSRPNLDTYLQKIYHDDSDLVVVVLCKEYDEKEWCGLEFRAIRDLIMKRRDDEIMFVRVGDGDVKGVFSIDGYVDAKNRPATEIAQVICERLAFLQAANS